MLIGAAAAAGVVGAAGTMGWAVRGRSSALFAPSVYHGDRSRRAIALTFDDGPSESTPALLEILAEHNIPATFLCAEKYAPLHVDRARGRYGRTRNRQPYRFASPARFPFARICLPRTRARPGVNPQDHRRCPAALSRSLRRPLVWIENRAAAPEPYGRHVDRPRPRLAMALASHFAPAPSTRIERRHFLSPRRTHHRARSRYSRHTSGRRICNTYTERARVSFRTVSQILCPTN